MNPQDQIFLKRAAECELMAKLTRDPDSRVAWKRMAARWQKCARAAVDASSSAAHHRSEPYKHRQPTPAWARH
jgi:hypothetical protein